MMIDKRNQKFRLKYYFVLFIQNEKQIKDAALVTRCLLKNFRVS
jgi:hypothetical protein